MDDKIRIIENNYRGNLTEGTAKVSVVKMETSNFRE